MTNKEREMYELIRQNPQISQVELAEHLGITRSSVSVHITNLIKKGYIQGRGYILKDSDYAVVIGAVNMDILGTTIDTLIPQDSNPGHISFCPGGVGRNIAENMARLQMEVKMISALCDDAFGKEIIKACEEVQLDMSHCYIAPQGVTSTYLAIIGHDGDMHVALSDMEVISNLPISHLQKKRQLLQRSCVLVMDANLPAELVEYVLTNFPEKKTYVDAVSIGKTKRIAHLIGRFHTLKCNAIEAGYLSGLQINTLKDCEQAADILLAKGLREVYITLGAKGVYYQSQKEKGDYCPPPLVAVNATGAGDAFMAGIVYCSLAGKTMAETAQFASAMSAIALKSERTVSTSITPEAVLTEMNQSI